MTRVSRLTTSQDFAVEARREELRDRRWRRQRSRIYAFGFLLVASGVGTHLPLLRGFGGWF